MKVLAALVLPLVLAGCDAEKLKQPREKLLATQITIWHDDQRQVTCWLYGGSNGGISCLPDGEIQR